MRRACPLIIQVQATLGYPICPVHGCTSFTARPGVPCTECQRAFGLDSPHPNHRYMRRVPVRAR